MAETTFLDASELVINMGPQHPATHGVLRVKLNLDGEKVVGSECIIGYLHRGVEKIAENRTYAQFAPYVDRMDYVAAVTSGMGYCEAVEKLLGAEIPPRAQYTRMILAELQRIASHLLWLGTHALDLGAMTPVFYTFREREEVLKIFENYCGARLTTHRIWMKRTQGVGKLSADDAIALGVTGPVLRGSGVKWDLRKAQPYEAY